jgi:hypothetical protein
LYRSVLEDNFRLVTCLILLPVGQIWEKLISAVVGYTTFTSTAAVVVVVVTFAAAAVVVAVSAAVAVSTVSQTLV